MTKMITTGALLAAAVAFYKQSRHDAAETVYRTVLRRDPNRADAVYGLGLVTLAKGDAQESVRLIEAAIGLGGEQANIRFGLGCALVGAGRLDEAIQAFERATNLDPTLAEAHHNSTIASH